MFRRGLYYFLFFLSISVQAQNSSFQEESWFLQLLTHLKSEQKLVVSSAREAFIAYGPDILPKLHAFEKEYPDPQLTQEIQKIKQALQNPSAYYLQKAQQNSSKLHQNLIQKVLQNPTIQFDYQQVYFNSKTIEVLPFEGNHVTEVIRNEWIHQLDQTPHFKVFEREVQDFSKATNPVIQVGGKVDWFFQNQNARLQLDLWVKEKNQLRFQFKKVFSGKGKEPLTTALKMVKPFIQKWVQEFHPSEKSVSYTFAPPQEENEWLAIQLAQQKKYQEALMVMEAKVFSYDSQKLNFALIQENAGYLQKALKTLESISSSQQTTQVFKETHQRLKQRLQPLE